MERMFVFVGFLFSKIVDRALEWYQTTNGATRPNSTTLNPESLSTSILASLTFLLESDSGVSWKERFMPGMRLGPCRL